MKRQVVFIIVLIISSVLYSQEGQPVDAQKEVIEEKEILQEKKEPLKKKVVFDKNKKPPVTDYKIFDSKNDTTYVDTTLTIQRDYKFNYLRRDDFGLLSLNNVGQTHNSLVKVEERQHLMPLFGARARHFNYIEADDVRYYNVPTPLTELYFKTTFEQGQQLDAFFTVNTSPRLNLSIAYKGIRSLGKYKHAVTSSGNFRTTANYKTKNGRYHVKTHFVAQDLLNEENGGLSPEGVQQYLAYGEYEGTEQRFSNRSAIEVNFEDAESVLKGKRFRFDHEYAIIKKTDSSSTALVIGHILDLTDKFFQFDQRSVAPNDMFGLSYVGKDLRDKVVLEDFTNQGYIGFSSKWLGGIKVKASKTNYNYGYNSLLTKVTALGEFLNITNRLKGDMHAVGGEYKNEYKGFGIFADGMTIVSGDFKGNHFNAGAEYELNKKYKAQVILSSNSVAPNYNFLLYQSDYVNYNWENTFDNIKTQKVQVTIKAKNIAGVEASFSKIDKYAYFAENTNGAIAPMQADETIKLLKLKATQGLKIWKLGIDNTVLYQSASGGEEVYNVPEIVTRNTLYYHDHWFKKALYLQAGATLKYFSEYTMDSYDPVLSEFYVQNKLKLGGFPQVDIFFNAKIRQTRIYFKVENFGEAFKPYQNHEFSSRGYAYRDAVIRFGLVWNFFL